MFSRRTLLQLSALGLASTSIDLILRGKPRRVTAAPTSPADDWADSFPADVAVTWFEKLYDIVKAEKTAPPQASRIYGIAAVALYESIVNATKTNRPLAGNVQVESQLNWWYDSFQQPAKA
jgi:hypothetical protein